MPVPVLLLTLLCENSALMVLATVIGFTKRMPSPVLLVIALLLNCALVMSLFTTWPPVPVNSTPFPAARRVVPLAVTGVVGDAQVRKARDYSKLNRIPSNPFPEIPFEDPAKAFVICRPVFVKTPVAVRPSAKVTVPVALAR